MQKIIIDEENQNKRIDIALSGLSDFTRSMIQKLIYSGNISTDGRVILKPNEVTKLNQEFEIIEPTPNVEHIIPEVGPLNILFEDEHIIVLNKDAHVVVHPGAGNRSGTLVNFLSHYSKLSDLNGMERLGVVHRLDKGVSGCIIFAKTNQAHLNVMQQFQDRTVQKEYIALCYGNYFNSHGIKLNPQQVVQTNGVMEDWMARSPVDRKKMAVIQDTKFIGRKFKNDNYDLDEIENSKTAHGKHAVMHYQVQNCFYVNEKVGFISQLQCFPKTGRMHQIRVQLSSRKLPIIGDEIYGKKQYKEIADLLGNRIALHAKSVEFKHPITNELMKIETELPKEFEAILAYLK